MPFTYRRCQVDLSDCCWFDVELSRLAFAATQAELAGTRTRIREGEPVRVPQSHLHLQAWWDTDYNDAGKLGVINKRRALFVEGRRFRKCYCTRH